MILKSGHSISHFYIILNQALGGSWVGEINPDDVPQEMLVDWVRVYQ